MKFRIVLTLSVSCLVVHGTISPARAQPVPAGTETPPATTTAPPPGPAQARTSAPTENPTSAPALEDIVVTALRRSESLVKTPAAVQAFTSQDIESANITRPRDFLALTPNVSLVETNHAGEAFVVIRGEAPARNAESSVAVVIDGVQQASANEFNSDLFDIQQIEVLKGPQGALYGRNSVAGAIVITTKQPTNEFEGFALGSIGNGSAEKFQGSISGPIIENQLLFKADVSFRNFDGLYTNVNTGEHVDRTQAIVGRGLLVWTPIDGTRVEARMNASDVNGGAIAFNPQIDRAGLGGLPPFTGPNAGYNCIQRVDSNSLCVPFVSDTRGYDRQNKNNQSLKIVQDVGFGQVVSVTAHAFIRDIYGAGQFPYTFGPSLLGPAETQWVYLDNDATSEDIRYVSPDNEPLRVIVGSYLLREESDRKTNIRLDGSGGFLFSGESPTFSGPDASTSYRFDRTKNGVYAFFGDVDYDILPNLTVTGAFRYDQENRTIDDKAPAPFSLFPGARAKAAYTKPQPKVSIRYGITDEASVYATYAEGFKSGGFNPFNSRALALVSDPHTVVQDSYPKESTRDYEVGFHSRWLEGKATLDGAAFYSIAHDAQIFEFFPIPSLQANASVDKAQKSGFEFSGSLLIIAGLTANASFGYTYSKIAELVADPALVGKRMPYAPLTNTAIGLQYEFPVADVFSGVPEDWTLLTRVDYERLGSTWWDIYNTPGTLRNPVNLVNLRAAVRNGNWTFAGWGKNVGNERYIDEAVVLTSALNVVHPAQMATYGFDLSYRF